MHYPLNSFMQKYVLEGQISYFLEIESGGRFLSREDGPALIHIDRYGNHEEYYLFGKKFSSQKDLDKYLKLKAFW